MTSKNIFLINAKDRRKSEDPSDLNNVLNALRGTTKGRLQYPEPISLEDNPDDVCDLKYIGDLSHISFTPGYSFGLRSESPDDDDDDDDEEEDEEEEDDPEVNISIRGLDRSFLNKSSEISTANVDLESLSNNHLNLMMYLSKLKLDEQCTSNIQMNCKRRREQYMTRLQEIWTSKEEDSKMVKQQQQQQREIEALRLQQLQTKTSLERSNKEEEYRQRVEERRSQLLAEVEEAKRREAKHVEEREILLQNLFSSQQLFSSILLQVTIDLQQLKEDVALDANTEKKLNATLKDVQDIIEAASERQVSDDELNKTKTAMDAGLVILTTIQSTLKNKKVAEEESANNAQEAAAIQMKQQQEHEEANKAQQLQILHEADEQAALEAQAINEANTLTDTVPPYVTHAELRFKELEKYNEQVALDAAKMKDDTTLRPLLSRAIGIVNQLNNDRHDSNRGKLQQIMNLLSGKSCTMGDKTVSTHNNASAVSFVKDQLGSRIVNLGHDKQVASMAVYASLVVRLWQSYPDLGQLILFRLYDVCPFLIPRIFTPMAGQTLEQYNRSVGFRHKDGGTCEGLDKFLTRMGAAAQLYGRIISLDLGSQPHPHGLKEGWNWFAAILSIPPHCTGTAAVIQGFLSTAGAALLKAYGKQFHKVLEYLLNTYLPNLIKETIEGGYSDIATIKKTLENYCKTGKLNAPQEGYRPIM